MAGGSSVVFRLKPDLPLDEGVPEAFTHFRRFPERSAVLVFDEAHHPTASLTDLLVGEMRSGRPIRALYLVHPTRALGLVASSVALASGGIPVRSLHGLADLEAILQEGQGTGSFRPSTLPRPHDVGAAHTSPGGMVVAACGEGAPEQVVLAFERLRGARARVGILLFSPDAALPIGLRDIILRELRASAHVRGLALVHPGPAAGFLASSIALELTDILIEAHASLAAATDLTKRVLPGGA